MDAISQTLDPETIVAYEKEYILHTWTAQRSYKPFVITRGEGCYFWDEGGKKYLDFASQLINVNAGHQHPRIVQAIKDQAERLCYVTPSAANEQRAKVAKMLAGIAPGDLNKSFLVTGGGVANENALKIARAVTGREKVISRFRSYHGGTYGASTVSGDPRRRAAEPGVPGSIRVWDPFCYRCFFKMTYPECDLYCVDAIREVVEVEGPETVAAVIVEPITGSNCRIVPPAGYMERLRELCNDYDMLLIFDEVMTGFGRTGEWFAACHWDVVPDIMTLSKAINSGALPLGAVMATDRIAEHFQDRILYAGLTQFGNPVACAAAVAAIEVYEDEGMIENSKTLGVYLLGRLEEIKRNHPSVGDVRGKGLFAGIELVKDRETREPVIPWTVEFYEKKHPLVGQLLGKLMRDGLYTYMRWNVLMICPPLCITKEELDWGLERIDDALIAADEYVSRV
jgi:taurine--2-oxoglutarate transaminase